MTHSLLSPSKASRWILCPGSIAMCKGKEQAPSEHAEEGKKAHALAELMLTGKPYAAADYDPEMIDCVRTYVETVESMAQGAAWELMVEEPLDLSDVVGIPGEKGTADCIAVLSDEIHVHDLKYGRGVKVDAPDNWQLILYALGAVELVSLITEPPKKVRVVIHQPRLGHVSEAVYTLDELYGRRDFAREQAKKALDYYSCESVSSDSLNPGATQCRWCLAKGTCEALRKYAIAQLIGDFEDLTQVEDLEHDIGRSIADVPNADDAVTARLLGAIDLVEQWCKAVREHAMSRMLAGATLPGWKLVEGRAGARKWSDEKIAEETLKALRLKVEEMYNREIISPTQAEKILKSSPKKWEKLQTLITRKEGGPAIAPESDKRPAIRSVKDDFEDLTNNQEEN